MALRRKQKKTKLQKGLGKLKSPIVGASLSKEDKENNREKELDRQIKEIEKKEKKTNLSRIGKYMEGKKIGRITPYIVKGAKLTARGLSASVHGFQRMQQWRDKQQQKELESMENQIKRLRLQTKLQRERYALAQERDKLREQLISRRHDFSVRKEVPTKKPRQRKRIRM